MNSPPKTKILQKIANRRRVIIFFVGLIIFASAIFLFGKKHLEKNNNQSQTPELLNDNFFEKPGVSSQNIPLISDQKNNTGELSTDNKESTIAQCQETIRENPQNVGAYNVLAMIYAKTDRDLALQTIDQGLTQNPNDFSLIQTGEVIKYALQNF